MSGPFEKDLPAVRAIESVTFEELAARDGVEAFAAGEQASANPFTPGSPLHDEWHKGFADAAAAAGKSGSTV